MDIKSKDGSLFITINVLIVEDNMTQADTISWSVDNYRSMFNGKTNFYGDLIEVRYQPIVNGIEGSLEGKFNGTTAVSSSKRYLMEQKKYPDIIMCDYNLMTNLSGTAILEYALELEMQGAGKSYKILHSIESEYQIYQRSKYVDFVWNAKGLEAIQSITLKRYEDKILGIFLFGNPTAHHSFFITHEKYHFRAIAKTQKLPNDILDQCVLYAYTNKEGKNIINYIDSTYKISFVYYKDPLNSYFQNNSLYIEIANNFYLSRLWFADHNSIKNCIRIITIEHAKSVLKMETFKRIFILNFIKRALEKRREVFPEFNLDTYFSL